MKGSDLSEAEAADDLGRGDDLACVALGVFSDVEHQADGVGWQGLSPNGSWFEECLFRSSPDGGQGTLNRRLRPPDKGCRLHRGVSRLPLQRYGLALTLAELLTPCIREQPIDAPGEVP